MLPSAHFWVQDSIQDTTYTQLLCLLRLFWVVTISQILLFFGIWAVLKKTGLIFTRMSLWELPDVLLVLGLELMGFFKDSTAQSTEVKSHFTTSYQRYILSTWLTTVEADLEHPSETVFVKFLYYKATLPFLPYCTLWENVTTCSPHLKNGKNTFCNKMARISATTIRIFVNAYRAYYMVMATLHRSCVLTHVLFVTAMRRSQGLEQ